MFRYDKSAVKQIEIQKKNLADKFLQDYYSYENRIDEIRLRRRLREEEKEAAIEAAAFLKSTERKNRLEEFEAKHKLELEEEQKRLEEFRDLKMRQYVRENSLEIRELESKLKQAYVNKLRATQIEEQKLLKARMKDKECEERKLLALEIEAAELKEKLKEESTNLNRIKYGNSLLDQIRFRKEVEKEEAIVQFIKDKAMIDEIMKTIMLEDQQILEQEFSKRKQFKEEIDIFIESQKIRNQKEEAKILEENEKILEYWKENDIREKDTREAFILKMKKVKDLQEYAYSLLEKCQKDSREEEELRLQIEMAKKEEEENEKERKALEKFLRQRLEMRCALNEQLKFKEQKMQAEKLEEQEFRERMLITLAEEAKLDQISDQKRRMKQLEHRREVESMILEREKQKSLEKQQEMEELEKLKQAISRRQLIIEEERLKLLREHANKLLGYLPKGIAFDV